MSSTTEGDIKEKAQLKRGDRIGEKPQIRAGGSKQGEKESAVTEARQQSASIAM